MGLNLHPNDTGYLGDRHRLKLRKPGFERSRKIAERSEILHKELRGISGLYGMWLFFDEAVTKL
ncbi:hypothetical protein LEP3755_45190 [Leptolyngbya sp. NIES-3755]|nr:hypothetical protein LEP3755_45190 [Leptolyngbya sp. NIES-3755]